MKIADRLHATFVALLSPEQRALFALLHQYPFPALGDFITCGNCGPTIEHEIAELGGVQ